MSLEEGRVDCCIVGCGPAGAILGLILARAGVDVTVLEKHEDFFRDYRGDSIHPPTLGVLEELGLIDRYLKLPIQRELAIKIVTNEGILPLADFANPKAKYPYVTFVSQWDFLSLLTEEAKRYPNFRLLMQAEGVDLLTSGTAIRGVRYQTPDGLRDLAATLTVAADYRMTYTFEPLGARTLVRIVLEGTPQGPASRVLSVLLGGLAARTVEGALRRDLDDLAAAAT